MTAVIALSLSSCTPMLSNNTDMNSIQEANTYNITKSNIKDHEMLETNKQETLLNAGSGGGISPATVQ